MWVTALPSRLEGFPGHTPGKRDPAHDLHPSGSLADTMMPEAFEYGGRAVGLATTFGFAVAVAIVALEHA